MRQSDFNVDSNVPALSFPACLLVFWFLGPSVGWLVVVAMVAIGELLTPDAPSSSHAPGIPALFVGLIGWAMAYVIGTVPAVLSAIAYWAFQRMTRVSVVRAIAASACTGAAASAGVAVVFLGGLGTLLEAGTWVMIVLPGVVAASVCAYACQSVQRSSRDSMRVNDPR